MAESKVIYLFDRTKHNLFMYPTLLEDGQTMPDNATDIVCPNSLFKPRFDETGKKWVGISQEEWEAKLPQHPVEPTDQQKLDAQTQIQLAQLLQQNKKQAAFNAQLTVDVATLKKQLAETTKTAQ